MKPHYADDSVTVYAGDCLDVLRDLPDASVDAVVTDPPYGLGFMGKEWDAPWKASGVGRGARVAAERAAELTERGKGHSTSAGPYLASGVDSVRVAGKPFQEWCEQWARECLRVLKPGGHMLAFGGSRTWHRLACAVEDAGFEIRDSIAWLYGSGFPKSLDVSKAIDKAAGAQREVVGVNQRAAQQTPKRDVTSLGAFAGTSPDLTAPATDAARTWQGWGTALKPAFEPVVVARKPLAGTVAANVLAHGTGALNIDGCRVAWGADGDKSAARKAKGYSDSARKALGGVVAAESVTGFTGEVIGTDASNGRWPPNVLMDDTQTVTLGPLGDPFPTFRYEPKAPSAERPRTDGVAHPTVKPLDLMRWLVRLVTPPGGVVLDPFAGSGTTAEACVIEGFRCITIEREATYLPLIEARLSKPIQPDMFGATA